MTRERRWITGAACLALIAALALSPALGGCGGGGGDENDYVVKQNGQVIGTETVRLREVSDGVFYEGTRRMPLASFDTTLSTTLKVSKDMRQALSYESSRAVPGATYRTWFSKAPAETGEGFQYLADDLQTYSYVPLLPGGVKTFPLELDSAALTQALLDRFLVAGVQEADAFVVIPSRSANVFRVLVQRTEELALRLTGTGLPETRIRFDENTFVEKVESGNILIEKGSASTPESKAFQPSGKAGRTSEVRVATTEKLKNGDPLELAGTMYFPAKASKPYKGIVLTGDRGPQDRTGAGFLSQVADYLAGRGYAVLVCDRRGVPESGGDYATHTRETLLSDLNTQVDYMVNRGDMDPERIALVGYGEGGLLSLGVASINPYVKRVAAMAAPSMTLFPDLARVQAAEAMAAGLIGESEAAAERTRIDEVSHAVGTTEGETLSIMGHEVFLGWMRSWQNAKIGDEIAGVKVPVLVLHGADDRVVPVSQADDLAGMLAAPTGGAVKLEKFDGLGHGFGRELDMAASKPFRQHPVVESKVLEALGAWMGEMK